MFDPEEQYKLYIELLCKPFTLFMFAFIYTLINIVLALVITSPSARREWITFFIYDLGFLWTVSGFFILLMIFRLRDVALNIFLDEDMPFPQKIKDNMRIYLCIVFSPYKFRDAKLPECFRKYIFLWHVVYHQIYVASFISVAAGVVGAAFAYSDYNSKIADGILLTSRDVYLNFIGALLGCAMIWFFVVTLICITIGIILILIEIKGGLSDANEAPNSLATILKMRTLNGIPITISINFSCSIILPI